MLHSVYKKGFITIGHVWFPNENKEEIQSHADILYIHGTELVSDIKRRYSINNNQYTLLTDLTMDEALLFNQIGKTVKYEINRSAKEGIIIKYYTSEDLVNHKYLVEELGNAYEKMYHQKGMKIKFNHQLVDAYINNGVLLLSVAQYSDNHNIVYHAYIYSDTNARLLYSTSTFRDGKIEANTVARANKYLHWEDLRYFKHRGLKVYDWGGISSLAHPNGIDRFKMEFAGVSHQYYNCIVGISKLGITLVRGYSLMKYIENLCR